MDVPYWVTVAVALVAAFLLQLARGSFSDFFIDVLIVAWGLALYFFPDRKLNRRRFAHTLGLLPLFAYYIARSPNLIPLDFKREAFAILAIVSSTSLLCLRVFKRARAAVRLA